MPPRMSTLAHERAIIESLKQMPKSISALSDDLGIQYYTVRRVIADLNKRNIIKVEDVVDRNTIYAYDGDERAHDYIPRFVDVVQRVSYKVVGLLEYIGNEHQMRSTKANVNLIKHITNLMRLSLEADQGIPVGDSLDKARTEISKDYLYLQNTAKIYEQILQEPRFWDAPSLAKMVHDPDFNPEIILKGWEYYRKLEENV